MNKNPDPSTLSMKQLVDKVEELQSKGLVNLSPLGQGHLNAIKAELKKRVRSQHARRRINNEKKR